MIERYIQFLGLEEAIELLNANENKLIPSIRTNTLKISTIELINRLEDKGFRVEPLDWMSYGLQITKSPMNLGSLHEYLQGYYYLQNAASMLPALILNPKSSEFVIDMCAAPGSKSTHLAQIMNNEGSLILIDRNQTRIAALEMNLRRMGISNSIVVNMDAIHISNLNVKADKILLDAPCTGEGLIRQDPTRKKSKTLNDIKKLSSIQRNLLKAGLASLRIGGKLLYSTCSIAPEENEFAVHDVIKESSNFVIIEIPKNYGVPGYTNIFNHDLIDSLSRSQRIYPHLHNTIGFFLCLIERVG